MIRMSCASVLAILLATPVMADGTYPKFSADFTVEIENDYTFSSTDPSAELNDTFTTTEGAFVLEIIEGTSFNATVLFEPVLDPMDDRFFEDHGLYVEELFFRQDFGGVALTLGKFNPSFGSAWDIAPGIYGVDFAEDYEITERIGGALTTPFEAIGGEHEFSFAVFAADTTFLSNSAIQDRGRTRERDGGVSNTQSLESFTFSLAGLVGDTGYNAGFQYQSRGQGDAFDQSGFVLGLTQAVPLGGDDALELLAEAAYFPHFDGAEESAFVGTLGIAAPVGPVTLSGVYAIRDVEAAPTDHLGTATAEIDLFDGMTAGLGYRYGQEAGETNHTLGVLLVYEFGVSTE